MKQKGSKKMREFQRAHVEASYEAELNRARSVTVGTCFGGTVEVILRANNGTVTWAQLQPVETIELIHQLAAGVGCHLTLRPRNDFSSWRSWRDVPGVDTPSVIATDIDKAVHVGAQLSAPEQQPGLQPAMMARSESNEQTVATEKTVGRKRAKRAATPA